MLLGRANTHSLYEPPSSRRMVATASVNNARDIAARVMGVVGRGTELGAGK